MDSNNSSTTMFSLEGVSPCMFPRYGSGDLDRKEALVMDVKFEHLRKLQNLARAGDEHLESALQAAWALLLRCYTGLDDVCFAVQKVRTESLEIDRSEAKNTFSSVSAMKMRFEDTTQLSEVVYKAKESYSRDIQYLEEGQKLSYHSHTSSERPVFNTLIMIEKQQGWRTRDVGNHRSFLDKLEMSYGGDICVHVSIGEESLNVSLEWWSSDMSQERAAHVASTFDKTLSTVLLSPATRVADLDYFSELDRQAINRWNQNDIGEEQTCIHEVIQNQVSSHPDADAVCAWDGNFTFAELSAHASRLAQYLLELGATTDTIIPLCFDKSKWNIVAMLAVLKAGAAFVPFDPSHPTDRLKSLAGKVRAGLLLCSRKYTASLASVVADVVPVDMGLMNQLRTVTKEPMSGVRSHDRAYLIFTSGTTGEPKGTLISHRAFCSSAKVHGPAMLMHSKCRVLQFAAHTFDASLVEILTTLMVGGCVCIPSEDARLNDVAGAIVAMHINWAVLTPSFVAFLEPRAVPGLTTLVLAGEAMSQDQITIWSNINLVNGYGPSECAVASLVKFPVTHETGPTDIGYPVGTRCWVADQYDHNRLVPPGCIGELLIEGPTLAEGYLDDERRTCESFIKDPTWVALTGSNTLSRRMYKTGDLVRQNCSNGSFNFVGRKDTQVKVHGQRVELGEIEHHVTSEQSIQHGLVLFPNAGLCAKRIVAVVSLVPSLLEESTNKRRLLHVVDGQEKEAADSQVDAVRQSLSRRLPLYMVPSIILVVESIPFLSSGKIDRKQITKWVESIDMNLYRHVTNTSETGNPPATKASSKTESIIQSVWGRVLGLPADQVSLDRAFLNLGGDSISAMQVMRQCQKRGIRLTIQDVIRSKSIRHLSLCAGEVNSLDQYTEAVEQTFDLSPIQKMFFDLPDQGRSHFNQSAFLRATRKIGEEDLHRAVHSIVERNSMLRARFSKSGPDAAWQQRVTADTVSSYRFKSHDCDGRDSAVSVIEQTQASLDAVNGPLFAVDLFNIAEHDQLIFLVGHHLVIDLVSWRVILEDIEELLTNPESASTAVVPLPFQTWCHLQEEHCKTLEVDDVLPSHDVPASDDAYWAMAGRPNVYGDVISENFEIDASTTSKLFSEGHEALRTENIDLLLSALLHAFSQVFTDRCAPAIYNEGHGREVWDSTIDLSKTVGWFTIMYPVWVPPAAARDLVETTRRVKDLRRQIPGNGRPYFASRLLTPAGEDKFKNQWPLEITFNYLGLYQQLERDDGLFVPAEKMAGEARGAGGIADVGHHTPRFGLFEISAVIVQDRLRFSFTFNRHMSHQEEIRSWVRQSQETLCVLANTLTQMKPERTLTDFPQLELTHDRFQMMTEKLERIGVAELDAVEDIYPCSQMQQGLLLSLTKDTAYYGVHVVYEVKPTASSAPQVDSLRLETAWEQVVHRHAALRTIFVESLSQDNAMYDQVVLKHISPDVVRIQRDSNAVAVAYLSELQAASNNDGRRPPHRFTICETAEGAVFCKLEISHTIMDGASMSIIFRDLGRAYEGLLAGPKPLYGDYIAYLRSQPIDTSLEFWRSYLENMEPSIFPILNQGLSIEKELHSVHMTFEELQQLQRLCDVHSVTLSNAIHTAWALTLRYYTGSDSVCFGYLTSSRDAAVEMAEEAVGPFINMLACRVAIPEDARVNDVIDQVQRDYISSIPHRNTPLAEVQHALRVSNHSALFNTVLSYRRLPSVPDGRLPAVSFHECAPIYDPTEYNVSINAEVSDEAAILTLDYWTDCLSDGQAANVADTFLQALRNITHKWDENIRRLDPLGEESKAKLRTWNRHIPERIDECAHTVVRRQAVADPAAPAICGWDASFSYAELDLLSERISYHLVDIGVQRESLVPICFDKSAWTIVAMLAILKAGAAFVPLDPSHPKSAIERRVRNSQANHVLVGPNRSEIFQDMVSHVVTVDSTLLAKLPEERRKPYAVDPDNACYVIYTSGSTGQPKGVVIEHASLVTSVRAHGPPLGFCRSSRVLQFAAYTFDNCLEEIFTTLMYGGCVCVPSEHDRLNDLAGAINRFQVNLMDITPTVASFLNPQEVPTLKALAFGGEAVNQKVLEMWAGKVSLHGIYGPTECSINCVYNGDIATCSEATNIGYAIGSVSWVVDPSDHNSLMPIGCIGELLIEGPILARGYFNDQVKTSAAFIKNPSWATKEPDFEGSVRRMYKTGDLVRYNPNGTLTYLGRKDTQVKLNGQRIEVGEIEHHVKVNLPSEAQSAVELITISSNQKSTKALAVFFCLESDGVVPTAGSTDFILPMSQGLTDTCRALEAALVEALQSYMVPSVYIPVVQMPMTSSGKLDRRTLKTTAEALPEENLADYRLAGKTGRAPSTHIEKLLQKLWASVLSIKPDSIGVDDSFFRLGGDSVSAMRLVTASRHEGILLSVASIFQRPKLVDLATHALTTSNGILPNPIQPAPRPFALLNGIDSLAGFIAGLADQCQVDKRLIEDIYPCTPIQEGLIALSNKDPGAYVAQSVYRLPSKMDITRFKKAWDTVAAEEPLLRTRIVYTKALGFLQVVVREPIAWRNFSELQQIPDMDRKVPLFDGGPLTRFSIAGEMKNDSCFVWTIHHALFDGWSIPLIHKRVQELYTMETSLDLAPSSPYSRFIAYLGELDADESDAFWKANLSDSSSHQFPKLPYASYQVPETSLLQHTAPITKEVGTDITMPSKIRAAWALVVAAYSNSDDVVFGEMVTGRDAPVPGIVDMMGPTLATIPRRLRIDRSLSVREYLEDVQRTSSEVLPYQQAGLQHIKKLSLDAEIACGFQNLIAISQGDTDFDESFWGPRNLEGVGNNFFTYPLTLSISIKDTTVELEAHYDQSLLPTWHVNKLLRCFESVLTQFAKATSEREQLGNVDMLSTEDRETITHWNSKALKASNQCVHDIIEQRALSLSSVAPAIRSWDSDFTYRELNEQSNHLARYLSEKKVAQNQLVPICFDKSAWTVVAMLAVLKAGGAFVPLDPSHPAARLGGIIQDTAAKIVLCSPQNKRLIESIAPMTLEIDKNSMNKLPLGRTSLPSCASNSPAYVIFTSGTTGTPKGTIVSHEAFSTGAVAHGSAMGMQETSRVLQFASYTFDASVMEILTTLIQGGCVCVPNESDRLNNIARTINELQVNWALLTPSFVQTISPSSIPGLKTLVLGGEAMSQSHISAWSERVVLMNAYGPSETSVIATVNPRVSKTTQPANIGKAVGGRCWIVDPVNHNRLAPIASIGELLVEGPILAQGYLGDRQKTANAFVKSPSWAREMSQADSSTSRRFYKTGDLVRYNEDGTILYLGRKDNQIKVRGQRLELGEVESNLAIDPSVKHGVAIMPTLGPCAKQITAVLSLQALAVPGSASSELQLIRAEDAREHLPSIRERLSACLPVYMVPSKWLFLHGLPLLPSGKLDRRQIAKFVESMDEDTYQQMCNLENTPQDEGHHATQVETQLRKIFSHVLNTPVEKIGLHQSFIHLGGDSIMAMQVMAQCRADKLGVTVQDVIQSKSIAELASRVTLPKKTVESAEEVDTPFQLSPIQRLYFECMGNEPNHFNQSVLLRLTSEKQPEDIVRAIDTIAASHSMLRARFSKSQAGEWEQKIIRDAAGSYRFRTHKTTPSQVAVLVKESQTCLDVQNGPLIGVDLFRFGGNESSILSIVAHHLIIDVVSWRIILQDLEDMLSTNEMSKQGSLTFQAWCRLQAEHAHLEKARRILPNMTDVPAPDLDYWGMSNASNTHGTSIDSSFELDVKATSLLLGASNGALETDIVDICIAGMLQSFHHIFTDRPRLPAIFNEGHGRDPWDHQMDLSRTVGWFTTITPVYLPNTPALDFDIVNILRWVKDLRRREPDKGREYFAYRFLTEDGRQQFSRHWPMEIAFNYLGHHQQMDRSGGLLQPVDGLPGQEIHTTSDIGEEVARFALIEISAGVTKGRLRFSFGYNKNMKRQQQITEWLSAYQKTLEEASERLAQMDAQPTLNKFPLMPPTFDGLANLATQLPKIGATSLEELEDAYPCSAMQQGILFSQLKHPEHYNYRSVLEVRPTHVAQPVDTVRLAEAWQNVVRRHASLRTVFIHNVSQQGLMDQVVLKKWLAKVKHVDHCDDVNVVDQLQSWPTPRFNDSKPPHCLMIAKTSASRVFCVLDISHAVSDGGSIPILLRDLAEAYSGQPAFDKEGPLFSEYISHIQSHSREADMDYWKSYLADIEPCFFPSLNQANQARETRQLRTFILPLAGASKLPAFCTQHGLTASNVLQLVWAIVLRSYTNSSDICFGYLTSGRDAPVRGIQDAVGAFINILVCRLNLSDNVELGKALQQTQTDFVRSMSHQYSSLADLQHHFGTSFFNTAFTYQRRSNTTERTGAPISFEVLDAHDPGEYSVTVNIEAFDHVVEVHLNYWSDVLSETQASNMASTFSHVLNSIVDSSNLELPVAELDTFSGESRQQVMKWNEKLPETVDSCVHTLIEQQSRIQPISKHAVFAWDGHLTYKQLDRLATRLASRLTAHGVQLETYVPICFEKSLWPIVAMLGIMKAGGAFVPLDPTHPVSRWKHIVNNVDAKLALCSANYQSKLSEAVETTFVVDSKSIGQKTNTPNISSAQEPKSNNTAYVIFTSGTTGLPKGTIIEHAQFCTSATEHAKAMFMRSDSRVFQFANYTFDASVMEILSTLIAGGCVCVPNEQERMSDIPGAIERMNVTWTLLTPSVANILDPDSVPSLKVLVTGGEAMSPGHISKWRGKAALINAYGPSETSVIAATSTKVDEDGTEVNKDTGTIGGSIGGRNWVVDPRDFNRLTPVGGIGELLVEGRHVARGYLKNEQKTADAFVTEPLWRKNNLLGQLDNRSERMYRTGDLVRYNTDGTLTYISRKDTQVKFNGQRIELGEIEFHVRNNLPQNMESAIELVVPPGRSAAKALSVFFSVPMDRTEAENQPTSTLDEILLPMSDDLQTRCKALDSALTRSLPAYMVPTIFVPLTRMPWTSSGKLDRNRLKQIVQSLSRDEILPYKLAGFAKKKAPVTATEKKLASLWENILNLPSGSLGLNDNFFRLGGDSIAAMRLINAAHAGHLGLTVQSIFEKPELSEMAVACTALSSGKEESSKPFTLLDQKENFTEVIDELAAACQVDKTMIQDAYPCSSLQEGLITLSIKEPGSYVARNAFKLGPEVDIDRFKAAWQKTINDMDILRTRIVHMKSSAFLQVVLHGHTETWHTAENLQDLYRQELALPEQNGSPLARYTIVQSKGSTERIFFLAIHHALYDGWSMPMILERVRSNYGQGITSGPKVPYARFIKYLLENQPKSSDAFWKSRLEGCSPVHFPQPRLRDAESTQKTQMLVHTVTLSRDTMGTEITISTVIRAAWAMLLRAYTGSEDVIFGQTLAGRDISVPGITDVIGPTLTTVPSRIRVDHSSTVRQYLQSVQQSTADTIPHQHAGLQHIKRINSDTAAACNFQNLLVIQPAEATSQDDFWTQLDNGPGANFFTYPLILECKIANQQIEISAHHDEDLISTWQVQRLINQFDTALNRLNDASRSNNKKLSQVETLSLQDVDILRAWNLRDQQSGVTCRRACDLGGENASNKPQALHAGSAWIVDPMDHNCLAPLGSVGELLLEGEDLEKAYNRTFPDSLAVHVEDPNWIAAFADNDPRTRRMLKTGRFANYDANGVLEVRGMKDHQVQLHGRRLDSQEIEEQLKSKTQVRDVVVFQPHTGRFKDDFVAVLSLEETVQKDAPASGNKIQLVEEGSIEAARSQLSEVQEHLSNHMSQAFMPTRWVMVQAIPSASSGNSDRKLVTDWIADIDEKTCEQIANQERMEKATDSAEPSTIFGKKMREIFSRVLNVPLEEVRLDQSFLNLGGDSITAMQVMAQARKEKISLSLHEIIRSQSITDLEQSADSHALQQGEQGDQEEKLDTVFELSPIQQLYFQAVNQPKLGSRFNQSQLLRLGREVSAEDIENAVKGIIGQHSMLRARFTKDASGVWKQRIIGDVSSSYRFKTHEVSQLRDINPAVSDSQSCLDVQNGPLFAADYFKIDGSSGVVFLVAHHLVVDIVSWNNIMQDLEELLDTGALMGDKPLPFQHWASMQADNAQERNASGNTQKLLPYDISSADMNYWGMLGKPNKYDDVVHKSFSIEKSVTQLALDECHTPLKTDMVDLFLGVIVHSFSRVFKDRQAPTVFNESHGREPWDPSIDISRTVGWFTAMCPFYVPVDKAKDDVVDTVKRMKDIRRKVPENGRPYFAHRFLTMDGRKRYRDHMPMEMAFNYLGRMQAADREDSLLQKIDFDTDDSSLRMVGDVDGNAPRFALFEVSAYVAAGQINFTINYNQKVKHQDGIQQWFTECQRTLAEAVTRLAKMPSEPTLSDYPIMPVGYDKLEKLTGEIFPKYGIQHHDEVEDVYPCSPMQEGLLLAQFVDHDRYLCHTEVEIRPTSYGSGSVDARKLVSAWQKVVNRHAALRTIFIDSIYQGDAFNQIVVKQAGSGAIFIECEESEVLDRMDAVRLRETNLKNKPPLPHQLTVCLTPNGKVFLKVEINHCVIDGESAFILMRDLGLAYEDKLPEDRGPRYSDYIAYIKGQPPSADVRFWRTYLKGVQPCFFPVLVDTPPAEKALGSVSLKFDRFNELQSLCKSLKVTLSNVMLVAWALVLREYVRTDDICFGYLTSGRDAPVSSIQDAIGAYINMLVSRIKITATSPLEEMFQSAQDDYLQSLPYQHCSLAQMQHDMEYSGNMFNTAVSIQNTGAEGEAAECALDFTPMRAHDPSEYGVTLNIRTTKQDEGAVLRYWTDHLSPTQAEEVMDKLSLVLSDALAQPKQTVMERDAANKARRMGTNQENSIGQVATTVVERNVVGQSLAPVMDRDAMKQLMSECVHRDMFKELVSECVQQTISELLRNNLVAFNKAETRADNSRNIVKSNFNETSNSNRVGGARTTKDIEAGRISESSDRTNPLEALNEKLLTLWSDALDLPKNEVGGEDSFFQLGGDSLVAMKMVGSALENGIALTVAEVFLHPVFNDMLAHITKTASSQATEVGNEEDGDHACQDLILDILDEPSYEPFSLLKTRNKEAFLQQHICTQLNVFRGGIEDVLPVTDFQAIAITGSLLESKWMLNYFTFEGQGKLDVARLRRSFADVVKAYPILRTIFVAHENQFLQVVLRTLEPDFTIFETDRDLGEYTRALEEQDRSSGPLLGRSYLRVALVKQAGSDHHCIMLRMSHAQYDGVAMPMILESLQSAYNNQPLLSGTSFPIYVNHAKQNPSGETYDYWRNLLRGSSMTDIVSRGKSKYNMLTAESTTLKQTIKLQSLSEKNITAATILKAAWALVLAQSSASSDVVFGVIVNGRNAAIPGLAQAVGPCLNINPVRAKVKPGSTALDLLQTIQGQQVANMPHESLGFRDIIKHCTDWPSWTSFSSVMKHQNTEDIHNYCFDDISYHVSGRGVDGELADITIVSVPYSDDEVEISLSFTQDSGISRNFCERLLNNLCTTAENISANPGVKLPSPSQLSRMPLQAADEIESASVVNQSDSLIGLAKIQSIALSNTLTQAWQQVLPKSNGGPQSVRPEDSFFDLGGDIVDLAVLVALLEKDGFRLRLEDAMRHPVLSEQVALLSQQQLLAQASDSSSSEEDLKLFPHVDVQAISIPPTPVQEQEQSRFWRRSIVRAKSLAKLGRREKA